MPPRPPAGQAETSTLNVLVLGASGMLGRALVSGLPGDGREVWGTYRRAGSEAVGRIVGDCDVLKEEDVLRAFETARPDVVINAVGVVKQLAAAADPLRTIPVNALLPHRLAALCALVGARLVHISTDCVFNGARGGYREEDPPDATDLYGVSKFLGEVGDAPHALTLRTSIIGREAGSRNGLVDWFLSAPGPVKGFAKAVFSGLTTVALTDLIRDVVLPDSELHGLYHASAAPIDKHSLLQALSRAYEKDTVITRSEEVVIDRSLDSTRFRARTGWQPPPWPDMLDQMRRVQG